MTGAEILKKYGDRWDELSKGKSYYDIPITIRRAYFTHACSHIAYDVQEFIIKKGYTQAVECFGQPICEWIRNGIEPEEF
jgi:hypothetical protein